MMKRDACLELLACHYPEGIVVAVYQAAFDWLAIRPHPLNYVAVGAMGQASSHALGLALGRPERKVVVLDGDGSLLMNLGSLVTIAAAAPPNLVHLLCYNAIYEVNGRYPIPGQDRVDFSALAAAAGYPSVYGFTELADFEAGLAELLSAEGPVFATLEMEQGRSYPAGFAYIHSPEPRRRFKEALRNS